MILAEKVVKPLMNRFLSGEMEIGDSNDFPSSVDSGPQQMKQFKCL